MDILHQAKRILSVLAWHFARFKLLAGIATLGAATAILVVSDRGRTNHRDPTIPLRLVPLVFAALSFLLLTGRSRADRRRAP